MALLVVPLAAGETALLTLHEWESLSSKEVVLFEDPNHPLIQRLRVAGVKAGPFDNEPDATKDRWALVTEPSSPRVVELARKGARVTAGVASPPDSLTAAHGAPVVRTAAAAVAELVALMARLRSADGCPWDREQSHDSLRAHLVEEAYEVTEAIETGLLGPELEDELGDLLLQVVFHAQLASDERRFDFAGVARAILEKLVRRHPHVFGDVVVSGSGDVVTNWETIKAAEKARDGLFAGIPAILPALLSAYKTQKRAASLGFRPDEGEARARLSAALDRELDASSVGEALFWVVALARAGGVEPEGALRRATSAFRASL